MPSPDGGLAPQIRRNTVLLFTAQVLLSAGVTTLGQLGSLIIHALTGAAALSGLPTAIYYLMGAGIAYPAGRLMDRYGRRPGLIAGFLVAGLGSVVVAGAVLQGHLGVYLSGTLIYGAGIAFGQLTRAAVADMYPVERRAAAVGIVVGGGLIGALGGPLLIALAGRVGGGLVRGPLALPWFFVVGLFILAASVVVRVKPDPRDIAIALRREAGSDIAPGPINRHRGPVGARVRDVIALGPVQAAMIALACAQGAMAMIMATASLMLSLHGHTMTTISFAVMAHYFGMFGFSIPIGRLADRVGRTPLLVSGAVITAAGGLLFTASIRSAVWAGMAFYLVGLGWSMAYVAGSSLLADLTAATIRARVFGVADLLTSLTAMASAFAGGLFLSHGGELTVGLLAAGLGSLPLLALLRLRSPRPLPVPVDVEP